MTTPTARVTDPTAAALPHLTASAAALVAALPLERKVALLSGRDAWHLEAVPEADLPAWTLTDGPHGVRRLADDGGDLDISDVTPATCFPTAITLAASWDEDLLEEVGHALGREAAALDVAVLLGPGLNLQRHPAGGRNFEYLSEDPVVAGRLAAALVRGVQAEGVGASVKHLAANHQESGRLTVDTLVDARTLHELELTAFELAVRGGRPWTVMSAYNRLNGVYAASDRWLLTDVLRHRWDSDALVISDWGAVADRRDSVRAGLDLEMPGGTGAFDAEVIRAVRSGTLDEAQVDRCATRVVTLSMRAAAAREARDGPLVVDPAAHHGLARRAAAAGTVLLTNDGTLPLRPGASVAVIGAFATTPRYQGAGSSKVMPTRLDDALAALRERWDGHVTYAAGYDPETGTSTPDMLERAVAVAGGADVAVAVVGLPAAEESEGFDRRRIGLPPDQDRLVRAVCDANPATVVVLVNGGVVEVPWADQPAAIVEAFLGGQAGGRAIVDVLTGDAEPGGRLAQSIPERVEQLPADPWFGDPRQVQHREGLAVGYRFHDTAGVPARFPFGHGLGYTTWALDDLHVEVGGGPSAAVRLRVTNTGDRTGSTVVQCYLAGPRGSAVPRPEQELRAFAKVHLEPGASTTIELALDRRAFAVWDVTVDDWCVEAGTYEVRVGTSSVETPRRARVRVASDDVPGPSVTPVAEAADDAGFAAALGRPIPPPRPALPFTRSSPIGDLGVTRTGRWVAKVLVAVGRRRASGLAGSDPAARRMAEAMLRELPLRNLVLFSGGALSFRVLDTLLRVLNATAGRH